MRNSYILNFLPPSVIVMYSNYSFNKLGQTIRRIITKEEEEKEEGGTRVYVTRVSYKRTKIGRYR